MASTTTTIILLVYTTITVISEINVNGGNSIAVHGYITGWPFQQQNYKVWKWLHFNVLKLISLSSVNNNFLS